jgi:two-component system sensor kinase FixL
MGALDDNRIVDALRTLQLSEKRWQAILDTARDAIICIDPRGCVTLFNRAAEDIFGYPAAEVLGQKVNMLMPPPYRDEHDGYLHAYQTTGEAKAIGRIRQVQARRRTGEIFPIELSVSVAQVGDEIIYSAIIRDMTDRRAIEAQLESARQHVQQSERLADVGAITAKIVHDIGNPLAGLSMQTQLLLRRTARDQSLAASRLREPAERIASEVRRLDTIVRDFLDFVRQQRLDVQSIQLSTFLQRLVYLWQPLAVERGIDVRVRPLSQVPEVSADEGKLRRVLDNLVKNAIEAIDHGPGRIDLAVTTPEPARVRIAVEDNGPGIPETVKLFHLFETTKRNGSGLGLSIARQIVLAHGGELAFERLAPRGTAFYVDLPARPVV